MCDSLIGLFLSDTNGLYQLVNLCILFMSFIGFFDPMEHQNAEGCGYFCLFSYN